MDDAIIKITIAKLRRWEGQVIDQKKLESLRTEIYAKTKTNKFAPFSNIKKWIKAARKEMAKKEKEAAKKAGAGAKAAAKAIREAEPVVAATSARVQSSMDQLKVEMAPEPPQEVAMPKPAIVFDKVYLQTITYEMASMRQALDRIGRQLDKLERELNQHRES
ncbi:MAG: hypothetical protein KGH63_03010 [Candidatus Micrarchaeota archaeon]|nr:hypothetical protein [Candidatus Micrarchaeota archaeon]